MDLITCGVGVSPARTGKMPSYKNYSLFTAIPGRVGSTHLS
ncbi:MAG: hypothetical protein NW220_24230 [Leptolyngbyaceae cyanobacterium bins.349]|nr:hypothetical protein [Leptolyngbyaceae cyanobacterium bins.349]